MGPQPAAHCHKRVRGLMRRGSLEATNVIDLHEQDEDATPYTEEDRSTYLRDRFGLLSPADLATLLEIDERTLATWRVQKRGPDFIKLGRQTFYKHRAIREWMDLNTVTTDR